MLSIAASPTFADNAPHLTGTSQFAFVGEQFGFPLRVLIEDVYGNPVSGITLTPWSRHSLRGGSACRMVRY